MGRRDAAIEREPRQPCGRAQIDKNCNVELHLLQAGQVPKGLRSPTFPERSFLFGARILHFGNSIIHETIIPNLSVPPGHAAAGRQACGGRYGGPGVRPPF